MYKNSRFKVLDEGIQEGHPHEWKMLMPHFVSKNDRGRDS